MRNTRIWSRLLDVEKTVIEQVEAEEGESGEDAGGSLVIVAHARPVRGRRQRCGDLWPQGGEVRRRRGTTSLAGPGHRRAHGIHRGRSAQGVLPGHGVTVAAVPWARHGAGHTLAFDAQVAWLATYCSKTAVTQLMRTGWRTVGSIVARVWADAEAQADRLAGLRRIGIDEISYKKRHKYLTVVVDHDSGRLLWAEPGRDKATLNKFFDLLGPERSAKITHVSADAADWAPARSPHTARTRYG